MHRRILSNVCSNNPHLFAADKLNLRKTDAFEQHTAVPTSEDALTKDESAVAADDRVSAQLTSRSW